MQGIIRYVARWDLRYLTKLFLILGVVLALVSGYLGYTRLYLTDERIFWRAIENSLATPSVTRTLTSGGSGNRVVQRQQLLFHNEPALVNQVLFDQSSATSSTEVLIDGYSFLDGQYSKYSAFQTSATDSEGNEVNIDEWIDRWASFEGSTPEEIEQLRANFINELISVVVFANVEADFRRLLITDMQANNVYAVDYSTVTRDVVNEQPARVYQVEVNLQKLAETMSRVLNHTGYGEFPPLDPSNFQPDATLSAVIAVSDRSGSVIGVDFGTRREEYAGYGVEKMIERPETELSLIELEQEVQRAIGSVL